MRFRSALVVLSLVVAACAQEPQVRTNENDAVTVTRGASAVGDSRVGAAALLRVTGSEPLGPISLELSFVDREGDELATTRDSLPFCPPTQGCWWGASFFAEDYGGRAIDRVVVRSGGTEPFGGGDTVRSFAVRRDKGGTIRGTAPGTQGAAYVIASSGDDRRWGTSVQLNGDAVVIVPADILPKLDGEELRGFFYAGATTPGD